MRLNHLCEGILVHLPWLSWAFYGGYGAAGVYEGRRAVTKSTLCVHEGDNDKENFFSYVVQLSSLIPASASRIA